MTLCVLLFVALFSVWRYWLEFNVHPTSSSPATHGIARSCTRFGIRRGLTVRQDVVQLQSGLLAKFSAAGKLSWFKVIVKIRTALCSDLFPLDVTLFVLTCPAGNLLKLMEYGGVSFDLSWFQSAPLLLDHNFV